MSKKRADRYLDRAVFGNDVLESFDVYVKANFELIKQYEEKLLDESIAPWHKQILYELSLVKFRQDIQRALEILRYTTIDSLRKNEQNLYRYFTEYQRFSTEVTEYLVSNIMRNNLSFSEMELLNQVDEIRAYSSDESSRANSWIYADEGRRLPIGFEQKGDGRIVILIEPNRTIEDVKWFVNGPLRNKFEKCNRTNIHTRQLRINMKGYVKGLLVNFLLQNYVSPTQAVPYVDKWLRELEKSKKRHKVNLRGEPIEDKESDDAISLSAVITDNDINKIRASNLNTSKDWFHQAYCEYNEYYERYNMQYDTLWQDVLNARADSPREKELLEQFKFLELSFVEEPKPTFHIKYIL